MRNFIIITLAFLCLPFASLSAQTNSAGQADSLPVYWMNEIVVTESRLPAAISPSMYRINRTEISRLDASQPAAALQFVPGVHLSKITKNETTIKLRGFEQRQISVFLDGVPISTPYDGQLDLSQLAGDNLQAIRVSRGASSILYGINTVGGSINILTGSFSAAQKIRVRLEASDHNRYFSAFNYQNSFKNLSYSLNLFREKGDDFKLSRAFKATDTEDGGKRDNSAFDKRNLGIKLRYHISANHSLGFNYTFINNEYNIPVDSKTNKPRYWRFPEWKKQVLSFNSKHIWGNFLLLRTTIYYDSFYNLLKSYDDGSYTTQQQRWAWNSIYDDYSTGLILYPSLKLFDFGSTNAVFSYKKDVHKEKFRDSGFDRYETAAYTAGVEQDVAISKTNSAVIGADVSYLRPLYADGLPLRNAILLVNGQVVFQHKFGNSFTAYFSVAKKSRFPTLKELYSERLGRTIANPNLKEEHALNSEIGFKKDFAQGYLQATLFYNNLNNLISAKELGDDTKQMQNIGMARFRGAELDVQLKADKFNLWANYTYLKAEDKSDNNDGGLLEYRPAHRLNFSTQWNFHDNMYVLIEASYSARQYYQNPSSTEWEALNDYALFNFKYNYHLFEFLSWYVRLNNFTDADYMSEYGVPMPGREFVSGLRFML